MSAESSDGKVGKPHGFITNHAMIVDGDEPCKHVFFFPVLVVALSK